MELTLHELIEQQKIAARFENLLKEELDLTLQELSIVQYAYDLKEGQPIYQVSKELGIMGSTAGSRITALVKKGIISKRRDENNDRYVLVFVGDDRRKKAEEVLEQAELLLVQVQDESNPDAVSNDVEQDETDEME